MLIFPNKTSKMQRLDNIQQTTKKKLQEEEAQEGEEPTGRTCKSRPLLFATALHSFCNIH